MPPVAAARILRYIGQTARDAYMRPLQTSRKYEIVPFSLLTHPKRLPHCGSLLLYNYQNFPPELPPKPSLSVLDPLELLSSLTGS